eukprot:TRINITY_DN12413_c0_g1_i1.p1 TRINITY_DN12413_c0_g1~~TRINITY_DN12413_c0_g1_i1.p1  ORF type:complete len:162 (-),score=36.85 TRINITY_DN12413_c0_g1_i1:577-1062(-)
MEPASSSPFVLLDNVLPKSSPNPKLTARTNLLGHFGIAAEAGNSQSASKDSLELVNRFPGIKRKYFKINKFGKIRYMGLSSLYLPSRLEDLPPVIIRKFTEAQLAAAFTLKDGGFEKKKKKDKGKDGASAGASQRAQQQLTPVSGPSAGRTGQTPTLSTPK